MEAICFPLSLFLILVDLNLEVIGTLIKIYTIRFDRCF